MSRGRARIVAVQAIVVSMLAVVVVVTLLKPEDSGLLSGVTTPGASEPPTLPTPGAYIPRTGGPGGSRQGGPDEGPGPAGAAIAGIAAPLGGTASVPAAPGTTAAGSAGPGGLGGGEGSPTDDQYADTLSRITARLN